MDKITQPFYNLIRITIFLIFNQNNNFRALDFNLSDGVTDTLESNSILIYFISVKGIYTQQDMFDKYKIKLHRKHYD